MCTILTVDLAAYIHSAADIIDRIYQDNSRNRDGLALVALDPDCPDNDLILKTFNVELIVKSIDSFFETAVSLDARIFLHQRMATGSSIHVGTMHAFGDMTGNIIMHNGIFRSAYDSTGSDVYAVDSFAMIDYMGFDNADEVLQALLQLKEHFTNLFIIRPDCYTYGVVKLRTGTLYTDGLGNYSTHPVAGLDLAVLDLTASEHRLGDTTAFNEYLSLVD